MRQTEKLWNTKRTEGKEVQRKSTSFIERQIEKRKEGPDQRNYISCEGGGVWKRQQRDRDGEQSCLCMCVCRKEMQGRGTKIKQGTRPQRRAVLGQDMKPTIV